MKTQKLIQSADSRRIVNTAILVTLVLAAAALMAPTSADAEIVVRARIGGVDVAYRDGDRCDGVRLAVRPAELLPVARRVLVSRPIAGCPGDGCKPVIGRRHGERGPVWIPGHWELRPQSKHGRGRGQGHGRGHDRLIKVWVAGHWCHR